MFEVPRAPTAPLVGGLQDLLQSQTLAWHNNRGINHISLKPVFTTRHRRILGKRSVEILQAHPKNFQEWCFRTAWGRGLQDEPKGLYLSKSLTLLQFFGQCQEQEG